MNVNDVISTATNEFNKVTEHLKSEYGRLQIGRASAALVENIPVEVYGASQPLKAVASISIPEFRTIQIQPWDKSLLGSIEKAIVGVGTGLNPVSDGINVRINIPPLTEERRRELTKHVKELAEQARISVRTARQDAHNHFKKLKADNQMTEDDFFTADKDLQAKVDGINKKIDEIAEAKEKDVMTV
ncbi:MAG: ribosome recycling factor [Candidatus Peregrinibacteria bacterium]